MKAVLVIDIADDVADAYEDFTVDYDLRGTPKDNQTVNESIKYVEDCPLKPMPSKKVPVFDPNSASYDEEYEKRIMDEIDGWNACLDEIMGETE